MKFKNAVPSSGLSMLDAGIAAAKIDVPEEIYSSMNKMVDVQSLVFEVAAAQLTNLSIDIDEDRDALRRLLSAEFADAKADEYYMTGSALDLKHVEQEAGFDELDKGSREYVQFVADTMFRNAYRRMHYLENETTAPMMLSLLSVPRIVQTPTSFILKQKETGELSDVEVLRAFYMNSEFWSTELQELSSRQISQSAADPNLAVLLNAGVYQRIKALNEKVESMFGEDFEDDSDL